MSRDYATALQPGDRARLCLKKKKMNIEGKWYLFINLLLSELCIFFSLRFISQVVKIRVPFFNYLERFSVLFYSIGSIHGSHDLVPGFLLIV